MVRVRNRVRLRSSVSYFMKKSNCISLCSKRHLALEQWTYFHRNSVIIFCKHSQKIANSVTYFP